MGEHELSSDSINATIRSVKLVIYLVIAGFLNNRPKTQNVDKSTFDPAIKNKQTFRTGTSTLETLPNITNYNHGR
jgi:hypothetical protein